MIAVQEDILASVASVPESVIETDRTLLIFAAVTNEYHALFSSGRGSKCSSAGIEALIAVTCTSHSQSIRSAESYGAVYSLASRHADCTETAP